MGLLSLGLDDKYAVEGGRVYLNGTQALVRLALEQRRRDLALGRDTAGFVTGYRGSPLGSVDKEFWRAQKFLDDHRIRYLPGVNEDLAATSLWGSQQLHLMEGALADGVFGLWYGKGPGVDRSGDVFRHANLAGTATWGGVLALAGDDPGCKSSTVPSQSEYALIDAQMPLLYPANVQDLFDFGLYGWAMSRFSGCWVGVKTLTDTAESSAAIEVGPDRAPIRRPDDVEFPDGGLHIRWPDPPLQQEDRLVRFKLPAAVAFARANGLNKIVIDAPAGAKARIGIVAAGKTYLDTIQALGDLGIGMDRAAAMGLRVLKIGMLWPLEPEIVETFAAGLDEIVVVEEKRPVLEGQIKNRLYNMPADRRPRVVGKTDETGKPLVPAASELDPGDIARVLAARLRPLGLGAEAVAGLAFLDARDEALRQPSADVARIPYFCAGCPHNTSTKVPEGSHAVAGIGCHYMAIWMDRRTATFTHMGGEGANWIGLAPFTSVPHVFANIGDGTYFHSGLLAIRAAVASGVTMTYKILYNDAVAMTGGQPMDGPLDVGMITRQVEAEGVARIAVVSEQPERYAGGAGLAAGTTVHHRDDMNDVQKTLRQGNGVSVIVYDQTCAAEKRRRRKRGLYPDPARRVFINEAVCEGCGDCGVKSNCVAIQPVETELGRKRMIDQGACNKDFSCLEGFCPSFVTVEGGMLKKPQGVGEKPFPALPPAVARTTDAPYRIVVTGIGGTGVVTVAQLLGMAAHLEGKAVAVLDVAGLAQKNGAVYSHLTIADKPDDIRATRIAAGGADLLIGCDIVTATAEETRRTLKPGHTQAVVNDHRVMTAAFTRDPDMAFPDRDLAATLIADTGTDACRFVDAGQLAAKLLGDTVAANVFMLGFAAQFGLLPVSMDAIERAIELNGAAVAANKNALLWGRRAAHDLAAVEAIAGRDATAKPADDSLQGFIDRRADDLVAYQGPALAAKYRHLVTRAAAAEAERTKGRAGLADAVARSYFKLLAYKDEYEVARLFSDGRFRKSLRETFAGDCTLNFHLAPPLIADIDQTTGEPRKRAFGPWAMTLFGWLAPFKFLRGTPFDPFGRSPDRRLERRLIAEFEATAEELIGRLSPDNHVLAVEIASLPLSMRGFGPVKARNVAAARARAADLMGALRAADVRPNAAE